MKEITDTVCEKKLRKLEEEIGLDDSIDIGGLSIPRKILDIAIRKHRYFDVDNIKDLNENYEFLSEQTCLPPMRVLYWFFSNFKEVYKYFSERDYLNSRGI